MINAVIFDFDGLLADSERLWRKTEQLVFAGLGVKLTEDDCLQTTGMRVEEVVNHWYKKYPWRNVSTGEVQEALLDEMIHIFQRESEPKPGAENTLVFFSQQRRQDGSSLPMAIASSSPCRLLEAAIQRFGWQSVFQVIHSAQDEPYGKPHPAVFLTAAARLAALPEECLAFEDSIPGLIASKAARMKCVAVPEAHNLADPRYTLADAVLNSLQEFTPGLWNVLKGR
ncbi:MAG: hexitol phosphatase HxpB [Anaerolineales bacterium]|jgi:sugar-phosphatase|nr:hexitol phosphatase HxpB [Anaerolineales bacterium]